MVQDSPKAALQREHGRRPKDRAHCEIRLFQDTLEMLVLRCAQLEWNVQASEELEDTFVSELAVLTGLPTAISVKADTTSSQPLPPVLIFEPTSSALVALRNAHREVRKELITAKGEQEAAEARVVLSMLAAIGRELRSANLWPAYIAAARGSFGRRLRR